MLQDIWLTRQPEDFARQSPAWYWLYFELSELRVKRNQDSPNFGVCNIVVPLERPGRGGLTGGFGLTWRRLKIDYALSPFGALGNVQTFSLSGRF